MALRFNKRIKLLPGVTLNLGKRGVSASFGPRGAKFTAHMDGTTRTTVGLPGTGLSSTTVRRPSQSAEDRPAPPTGVAPHVPDAGRGTLYLAVIVVLSMAAIVKACT